MKLGMEVPVYHMQNKLATNFECHAHCPRKCCNFSLFDELFKSELSTSAKT